jgi:hypothetical protein
MKLNYLILSIAILFLMNSSIAMPTKKYGKSLTLKKPIPISVILESPEKYKGKKVLVEGTVVDVCKKRGCWIKIAGDKEFESIKFKVEDGVMTFPVEAKGKKALAEGIFSYEVVSKEELIEQGKKNAIEKGEKFDSTSIEGPETYIRINGLGAEIK